MALQWIQLAVNKFLIAFFQITGVLFSQIIPVIHFNA